jgi:Xaa-Pro dipeptidase
MVLLQFGKMTVEDIETILKGKYPAKAHAQRVADFIQKNTDATNGLIYLEAQKTVLQEDNDEPVPFRWAHTP